MKITHETIEALALRVENFEAKIQAAEIETERTLRESDRLMNKDDLFWNEVFLGYLAEAIETTTRKLIAARRTLEWARSVRT